MEGVGKLSCNQFALAMWLVQRALRGVAPPPALTPDMIPPPQDQLQLLAQVTLAFLVRFRMTTNTVNQYSAGTRWKFRTCGSAETNT